MKRSFDKNYDMVVIGGGATGSGIALDATARGYKVLLLEKNDFASGTSSKSSKLVHGGVRYLEKAVLKLDKSQYDLVKEALDERYYFLNNAPSLTSKLKINTPVSNWFELIYMYAGLFFYKLLSFDKSLGDNSYVNTTLLSLFFPNLKNENLQGAVSFYDGTFIDSRMNLSIVQTAHNLGCDVANYHEVKSFEYDENGNIKALVFKDSLENIEYSVESSCIVNATGIAVDKVRKLDDKNTDDILMLSSGVHIVVSKEFLPTKEAILISKTKDKRIIFILPFMGKCLIGTTDESCEYSDEPKASRKEKEYLLEHVNEYLKTKIELSDIESSFSGIRPLIKPNKNKSSQQVVREHQIFKSKSNLVSIAGGKWTTYRKMAEELVDYCEKQKLLKFNTNSLTKELKLFGSIKDLNIIKEELDKVDIIDSITRKSLLTLYGGKVLDVIKIAQENKSFELIDKELPYIKAEVIYSLRYEFVKEPIDFLARRILICFLDKKAALRCVENVCKIMAYELSWSEEKLKIKIEETNKTIEKLF